MDANDELFDYTQKKVWGDILNVYPFQEAGNPEAGLINRLMKDGVQNIQAQQEAMIREKLSLKGFTFDTRQEFLDFAKERVTKVSGLDHKGTTWLYVDMYTPNEKAICSFIDEYSTKEEDGKIIITWGQRIVS